MEYIDIRREDRLVFYRLLSAYYREGEDAETSQEELDSFIRYLFDKVIGGELHGCLVMDDGAPVGFALWAVDTEDFPFTEMPGLGTILEIGLIPAHRGCGQGRKLVSFLEVHLSNQGVSQCYVCAYGPARLFWKRCGYEDSGKTGRNGLPILIKTIR